MANLGKLRQEQRAAHEAAFAQAERYVAVLDMMACNPGMPLRIAEQLVYQGVATQPVRQPDEWIEAGYNMPRRIKKVDVIDVEGDAIGYIPQELVEETLFSTPIDDGSGMGGILDRASGEMDPVAYIESLVDTRDGAGMSIGAISAQYVAMRRAGIEPLGALGEETLSAMMEGSIEEADAVDAAIKRLTNKIRKDAETGRARRTEVGEVAVVAEEGLGKAALEKQVDTHSQNAEGSRRGEASGQPEVTHVSASWEMLQGTLFDTPRMEDDKPESGREPERTLEIGAAYKRREGIAEETVDEEKAEENAQRADEADIEVAESDTIEVDAASGEPEAEGREKEETARLEPIDWRPQVGTATRVTPREQVAENVAAIRLVRELEKEGRLATAEEQAVLARYEGWGGLSDVFDENDDTWAESRSQIKELLTPREYEAAMRSTLTAFYTPPYVAEALTSTLGRFGFEGGDVLEPAMGVGAIIASMPEEMRRASTVYGVELDAISAKIAEQLQQSTIVSNSGIEATEFTPGSFDAVIGNVPFGDFSVYDGDYAGLGFKIHDYFFAKALDEVRPGGMVAFITSKGTMDKASESVRRYIAERAEFIGAVRLPDDTFKGNAGTIVTSDIIFLKRREERVDNPHDVWIETVEFSRIGEGRTIPINRYFEENPEMVLGRMTVESGPWGMRSACKPDGRDMKLALPAALAKLEASYMQAEEKPPVMSAELTKEVIAGLEMESFALVDGKLYFKHNGHVEESTASGRARERIMSMVRLRDTLLELNQVQRSDEGDARCDALRARLNEEYDGHVKKYGYVSSAENRRRFGEDSRYPLLCSLEVPANDGTGRYDKADVFKQRTMRPAKVVTHVDTASEALALSVAERGSVDMAYMQMLTGRSEEELVEELGDAIFVDHNTLAWEEPRWLTAEEYLSGNVRKKLEEARGVAEEHSGAASRLEGNIAALQAAMPPEILPEDIVINLGATWIPQQYVEQFTYELLKTPWRNRRGTDSWDPKPIEIDYSRETGRWHVSNKSADRSVVATEQWGIEEKNAYEIIEDTLNLNPIKITKTILVPGERGWEEKKVINREATAAALAKQESIRQQFREWLLKEEPRRSELTQLYNRLFNSHVLRKYDGSNLVFHGMAGDIALREHQSNAVARILHGGNTLLGHCVGAGKTFEMVAAAQESKRLGLCTKSMFVVPNHLTGQWGAEYLRLYPDAKVLVTTKNDFTKDKRRRLLGRMMTGDWDAIIIGHSQFEKIPLSAARQAEFMQKELDTTVAAWMRMKEEESDGWTVKQLEKKKAQIEQKLEKLKNDIETGKDWGICFEEIGVDRLFIDEAHEFKNLAFDTKMSRVAGVNTNGAVKSMDLYMKCGYLNELTGERGVVFATGTPISNSIVEMYTMQRYLQPRALEEAGCGTFDEWASNFTEQVTALEINPTGTGFRNHTRLARFDNLPELMGLFNQVADIKTSEDLDLPVPTAIHNNVIVEASEVQKEMVAQLGVRADAVHNRAVQPEVDNMLKITHEGRLLALDARTLDENTPDNPTGKISACADNVARIYREHGDIKATQIVFCDISTPSGKTTAGFCGYEDLKAKLAQRGIPQEEVAFIHDAKTDTQREKLFEKVRGGEVRVLIGSTAKMGTGTNVQDRLIATHDLDCPWRPSDLEQRAGRTIRQGNMHDEVGVYRYVTKGTFDSYLYQMVEGKQRFISQVMSGKTGARSVDEVDTATLKYAEIKAAATGDPKIKEKLEVDNRVAELEMARSNWAKSQDMLKRKVETELPRRLASMEERLAGMKADAARLASEIPGGEIITLAGRRYWDKKEAADAMTETVRNLKEGASERAEVGSFMGMGLTLSVDIYRGTVSAMLKGEATYKVDLVTEGHANINRLEGTMRAIPGEMALLEERIVETRRDYEDAQRSAGVPFEGEEELRRCREKAAELAYLLGTDEENETQIVEEGAEPSQMGGETIDTSEFTRKQIATIRKIMKANKDAESSERKPVEMLIGNREVEESQWLTAADALVGGCGEEYCAWLMGLKLESPYLAQTVHSVASRASYTVEELKDIFTAAEPGKELGYSDVQKVNAAVTECNRHGTKASVESIRQVMEMDIEPYKGRQMYERLAEGKDYSLYGTYDLRTANEYYRLLDAGLDFKQIADAGGDGSDLGFAERLCQKGLPEAEACKFVTSVLDSTVGFKKVAERLVEEGYPLDGLERYQDVRYTYWEETYRKLKREYDEATPDNPGGSRHGDGSIKPASIGTYAAPCAALGRCI